MSTYTTRWDTWQTLFQRAVQTISLDKLGVGLQCNTPTPLSEHDLAERFKLIFANQIEEIDIWATPIPDFWWPWIHRFALLP